MALSRDALREAAAKESIASKDVDVPDLGVVRVRELTGLLRSRVEAWGASDRSDVRKLEELNRAIVAACVLDDQGQPVGDQIARDLSRNRPSAVFRLRREVFKLSALDEDDLDGLTEDFGDDQSGGSTSGSLPS